MNPKDPLNDIFKQLENCISTDLSSKEKVWTLLEDELSHSRKLSLMRNLIIAILVTLLAIGTYVLFKTNEKNALATVKTSERPSSPPSGIVHNNTETFIIHSSKKKEIL
ncbi:hypothetical protein GNY06_13065 [Elizabethkingia argentiflava]|uniref:Uncharacterized protein n=1 Tax=Elizabethkingia argenteiflava TaxID=2681556 RepID=A0A845PZN0_9FLAO|nr:hypothetical protein [Elizabethkingia argenteiflava]NAW52266.1 hypothetical protein [Elizabethkingia argenteiflava]